MHQLSFQKLIMHLNMLILLFQKFHLLLQLLRWLPIQLFPNFSYFNSKFFYTHPWLLQLSLLIFGLNMIIFLLNQKHFQLQRLISLIFLLAMISQMLLQNSFQLFQLKFMPSYLDHQLPLMRLQLFDLIILHFIKIIQLFFLPNQL